MNIVFFSMVNVKSLEERNIYTDLIKELIKLGNYVTMISPIEKRFDTEDEEISGDGFRIIKPHVGNITNTPLIEKGISVLQIPRQIIKCIDKNIKNDIDLFITATPPVTMDVVMKHVKKKYKAKIYLLLKDMWPGNIFKMKLPGGRISQTAVYCVLRPHEAALYRLADSIGCMSPACLEYVIEQNPSINKSKLHINPNSIIPKPFVQMKKDEKEMIRQKYHIPLNKVCFIYGGTLGIGQGIKHVTECLEECKELDCFFLIIGKGVQKPIIDQYYEQRGRENKPLNFSVFEWIPKDDYDLLLRACDVGMIFTRKESVVPTFPSRILSYMEYGKPVLSCVSEATGVNNIIEEGHFGWGCYSDNALAFKKTVERALASDLMDYGTKSRIYLEDHYVAESSARIIIEKVNENERNIIRG